MKVKITVEENGKQFDLVREVSMGAVHVGVGIVPLKELASWIPTMYPKARLVRVEEVK